MFFLRIFLWVVASMSLVFPVVGSAMSTGTSMDTSLETIGILLNHQDFDSAFRKFNTLNATPTEFQKLSYESILTYTNLMHFSSGYTQQAIEQYIATHPSDVRRSALITRMESGRSKKRDCLSEKMKSSSDLVDKWFCILYSEKYTPTLKKRLLLALITRAQSEFPKESDSQKIQLQSDLLNLISYTINHLGKRLDTTEKSSLMKHQNLLSEAILQKDPHFVNGYFGLFATTDKKDCATLRSIQTRLLQNYRGDQSRKKTIIDPALSQYLIHCQ